MFKAHHPFVRLFGCCWVAIATAIAVGLFALGTRGEPLDLARGATWLAVSWMVVIAGAAAALPAGLLAVLLWAANFRRSLPPTGRASEHQ